jgi:outer membrane protein OmpA-like peptidoglycan-associated protein
VKIENRILCLPVTSATSLEPSAGGHHWPGRVDHPATIHVETNLYSLLEDFMKNSSILKFLVVFGCLTLTTSAMAYQNDSRKMQSQVASGQKMKVTGLVLKHDGNNVILRDTKGSEMSVQLSGSTQIVEKKGNPFRGSKHYTTDQVVRGLYIEVEGHGDTSGALIAEKIRFTDDSERVAQSIDSTVVPVENRVGVAENRLTEAEQNAQRLSGQVNELTEVANLAKGGAAQAQKTADEAMAGVNKANERIESLDDYQEKNTSTINFKVGSAVLTAEAKEALDQIASQAKSEKGFVIEVRGFASSDGSESLNDRLSERRADAVVKYLAKQGEVPLRRIVLPFGYGTAMPVADNSTRDGRKQNRRVEVKIMVSKGLTS